MGDVYSLGAVPVSENAIVMGLADLGLTYLADFYKYLVRPFGAVAQLDRAQDF